MSQHVRERREESLNAALEGRFQSSSSELSDLVLSLVCEQESDTSDSNQGSILWVE